MRSALLFAFTSFTLMGSSSAFSAPPIPGSIVQLFGDLRLLQTPVELVTFKVTTSIMIHGSLAFLNASSAHKGELITGWLTADELAIFISDNARDTIITRWTRNLYYQGILLNQAEATGVLDSILPHL